MNSLNSVPTFVRSIPKNSKDTTYVNVNDISKITKVDDNHWEAEAINGKNTFGGPATYHFDDNSAIQIINNMTGRYAPKIGPLPKTTSQCYPSE